MKIIDETGAVVENPDLTLGYLTDDTQPLEHPAQEAVAEVAHYETVAEYPSGGRDVQRVVDVPGVPARPAWTEQLPIKRYIRYTAEELAQREADKKAAEDAKAEADRKKAEQDALPQRVADLEAENAQLKEQLSAQESSMTDLQLALCSLYEQAEGSETE